MMKTTQRQWPSSLGLTFSQQFFSEYLGPRDVAYHVPPPPPELELDELPELPLLPEEVELATSPTLLHRLWYQLVRVANPEGSVAQAASHTPPVVVEKAASRASEQKQAS